MGLDAKLSRIHIRTYEEIIEIVKRRYSKGARGAAGIQMVYDVAMSGTEGVKEFSTILKNLHPFYMRLLEIEYEPMELKGAISCVMRARGVAEMLMKRYRRLVERGDPRVYREARGRILSAYRKCRRGLSLLKEALVFLQRLPQIEADAPTIIVAGPPNVGKSTFVGNVSSAKPEVATYPFTTKQVIVGHMRSGDMKIQIIDTPGLLDRPIEEMNKIERRAIAALRELSGIVLFFIDPTAPGLRNQLKVLENIRALLSGKRVIICINKADIASKDQIETARALAEEAVKSGLADMIEVLTAINKEDAQRVAAMVMRLLEPSGSRGSLS